MVIGIDGTTATGKGTVAKAIGDSLGFKVVDTGAVLRAGAHEFIERGLDDTDEKIVNNFVSEIKVEIKFDGDRQQVFVNGVDKTPFLRKQEVGQMASKLARYPAFLDFKNESLRELAKECDCVVDGRDICTEVFPDAAVKFFFQADPKVRAKRRIAQLQASGQTTSFDEIYEDLLRRDERDMTRTHAPLRQAPDSIVIDNTYETQQETIDRCLAIIKEKMSQNQLKTIKMCTKQ